MVEPTATDRMAPIKDEPHIKGEEPTEGSEHSMVEVTVASPENNAASLDGSNKEDTPIPVDHLPRRRQRFALFCFTFVILICIVIGCISVLVVLMKNKHPEEDYIRPETADAEHMADPPTNTLMMGCTRDAHLCPDGSYVGRDRNNNCEFYPCPDLPPSPSFKEEDKEPQAEVPSLCPSDVMICSDLSTVLRSGPDCEFADCPVGACFVETHTCQDGTLVGRDPVNQCEFHPCPAEAQQQQQDTQEPTSTGTTTAPEQQQEQTQEQENQPNSYWTTSPEPEQQKTQEPTTTNNNSEASPQEFQPPVCPRDIKFCTDLTTVTRVGRNCEFAPCPAGACMVESKTCSDGTTTVGRDPDNNCEFKACPQEEQQPEQLEEGECPEGINPREIKLCPDFSFVTRSGPNCEFELCPP